MNKLIEKLKTLLPSNANKIIFTIILYFTCTLFSFTFINTFNISSVGLTILVTFICGLILLCIMEAIIMLLPRVLNANFNISQYYVVFHIIYSIELFLFCLISFLSNLYSPLLFLVLGMLIFIGLCWFNIIFQFNYFSGLIKNKKTKILQTVKIYNIFIISTVLIIWFIL